MSRQSARWGDPERHLRRDRSDAASAFAALSGLCALACDVGNRDAICAAADAAAFAGSARDSPDAKIGIGGMISELLKVYGWHAHVSWAGAGLLAKLASDAPLARLERFVREGVGSGLIESAFLTHATDAPVITAACAAVERLARSPAARAFLARLCIADGRKGIHKAYTTDERPLPAIIVGRKAAA